MAYFFIISLVVFGRLLPHLPNMTPLFASCFFLLARGYKLWPSVVAVLAALALSDWVLNQAYEVEFSAWSLCTYGAVLVIFMSHAGWTRAPEPSFKALGLTSLGFWVVSNLGVFMSGYYSLTLSGLVICYWFALPFLAMQWLGDQLWYRVLKLFSSIRIFSLTGRAAL
jgi:hypothetical protein